MHACKHAALSRGSDGDCGPLAVSSVEDPEKMLDQTVTEMQNDLIKMRQASAQVPNGGLLRLPCAFCPRPVAA